MLKQTSNRHNLNAHKFHQCGILWLVEKREVKIDNVTLLIMNLNYVHNCIKYAHNKKGCTIDLQFFSSKFDMADAQSTSQIQFNILEVIHLAWRTTIYASRVCSSHIMKNLMKVSKECQAKISIELARIAKPKISIEFDRIWCENNVFCSHILTSLKWKLSPLVTSLIHCPKEPH